MLRPSMGLSKRWGTCAHQVAWRKGGRRNDLAKVTILFVSLVSLISVLFWFLRALVSTDVVPVSVLPEFDIVGATVLALQNPVALRRAST